MAQQQEPEVKEPEDYEQKNDLVKYDQPENSIIDETVATKICSDNELLLAAVGRSLTIVQLMGKSFDRNENTAMAKPLALSIQSAGATIISARGAMRSSMQLIMEIQRYKPAKMDDKNSKLWQAIIDSAHNVIDSTMAVSETTGKYFSLLKKIYDSVQYFITSQKTVNKKKNKNKPVPLGLSLKYLRADCADFCAFKNELDTKITGLTKRTLGSMKAVIESAIGDSNIVKWQNQLTEWKTKHENRLQALFDTRKKWTDQIAPLEGKLTAYQVDRDQLQLRINLAEGRVKDLSAAIKQCESNASSYRSRAANATKSVPYTYTQNYTIRRTSRSWFSSTISYRTESSQKTGWRSETDHDAKNRLEGAAGNEENVAKKREESQKATEKEIAEWTKLLAEDKKQISETKKKLETLRKDEKLDVEEKEQAIEESRAKIKSALEEIEEICRAAGQQENNVVDFLMLLSRLVPASMQTADGAIQMNESIKTFEEVITRRTKTRLAIKDYFIEKELDIKYVKALQAQGYNNMEQLICDDKEDWKDDFLSIYISVNETMDGRTKKVLREFSLKSKIWKPRDEQEQDVSRQLLLGQFPVLKSFFLVIQQRLDAACKQIRIEARSSNDNQTHKQFMLEYIQPTLTIEEINDDEKVPEIQEIDDDDDDNDDNDDDDDDKKNQETTLFVLSIQKSRLTCLDDEFNKIRIKVESKKMQNKIEKYMQKGKEQGRDVKVSVLKKGGDGDDEDDIDYEVMNVEMAESDDNKSCEEEEETLIVSSIKESKLTCLDDDFNKIKFKVKSSKMRDKIKKYMKKGRKQRKDVKVIVSKKMIGKYDVKYNVLNVEMVESDEGSDSSEESDQEEKTVLIAKKIEKSKLTCLDDEMDKIVIKVKSKKMQDKIAKYLKKGKKLKKNVKVNVLQTKKGKDVLKCKVLSVDLVASDESGDDSSDDDTESDDSSDDDDSDDKQSKKPKNKKGKAVKKKNRKSKKSKRKISSSDSDSDSDSDDETYSKKKGKGDKKKSKKSKKSKRKISSSDNESESDSDSDDDDSDGDSGNETYSKKKGKGDKKKSKKKSKRKVSSSDQDDEDDSESDTDKKKRKKKRDKKKSKASTKGESDESD